MPYIYINKKTNDLQCLGSIKALSKATGIKLNKLYTIFSRKKAKEHQTNEFRIVKTKIERA